MDLLDAITVALDDVTIWQHGDSDGIAILPAERWRAIVAARDEAQALMDNAADWQESR